MFHALDLLSYASWGVSWVGENVFGIPVTEMKQEVKLTSSKYPLSDSMGSVFNCQPETFISQLGHATMVSASTVATLGGIGLSPWVLGAAAVASAGLSITGYDETLHSMLSGYQTLEMGIAAYKAITNPGYTLVTKLATYGGIFTLEKILEKSVGKWTNGIVAAYGSHGPAGAFVHATTKAIDGVASYGISDWDRNYITDYKNIIFGADASISNSLGYKQSYLDQFMGYLNKQIYKNQYVNAALDFAALSYIACKAFGLTGLLTNGFWTTLEEVQSRQEVLKELKGKGPREAINPDMLDEVGNSYKNSPKYKMLGQVKKVQKGMDADMLDEVGNIKGVGNSYKDSSEYKRMNQLKQAPKAMDADMLDKVGNIKGVGNSYKDSSEYKRINQLKQAPKVVDADILDKVGNSYKDSSEYKRMNQLKQPPKAMDVDMLDDVGNIKGVGNSYKDSSQEDNMLSAAQYLSGHDELASLKRSIRHVNEVNYLCQQMDSFNIENFMNGGGENNLLDYNNALQYCDGNVLDVNSHYSSTATLAAGLEGTSGLGGGLFSGLPNIFGFLS